MTLDTDAIAARLATITPYPWEWYDTGDREENAHLRGANGEDVCDFGNRARYYPTDGVEPNEADAAFIASAPGDIAALLAEVATLREALEGFMNRHTSASRGDYAPCRCYQCQVARDVLGVSRLTEEPQQ